MWWTILLEKVPHPHQPRRVRSGKIWFSNPGYTTYNFNIHIIYLYSFLPKKKISNSNNTPLDTEHHQYHYPRTNSQKLTISVKKLRKLKLPVPQHQVEQPLQLDQHWEQQYQSWCLVKKTLYVAVRELLTIFYVIIMPDIFQFLIIM